MPATRRLLLVEDDPAVLGMFELLLGTLGWEVMTARDGGEAMETLSTLQQPVSAIVTDYLMPRMGGGELAAALRGSKVFRDLPILVMTALPASDPRLDEIRALPRCAVVAKTDAAHPEALARQLESLLTPVGP